MGFTGGVIAVAAAITLMFFAKAKNGVERPIARNWMALVGVTMSFMLLLVVGIASIITNWPI